MNNLPSIKDFSLSLTAKEVEFLWEGFSWMNINDRKRDSIGIEHLSSLDKKLNILFNELDVENEKKHQT